MKVLDRCGVDVAERPAVDEEHVGVAGRRALGAEIPHVEMVAGEHRVDALAEIPPAHIGVPLASHKHGVARRRVGLPEEQGPTGFSLQPDPAKSPGPQPLPERPIS